MAVGWACEVAVVVVGCMEIVVVSVIVTVTVAGCTDIVVVAVADPPVDVPGVNALMIVAVPMETDARLSLTCTTLPATLIPT